MVPRPPFTPAFARLVSTGIDHARCYRPLVKGPALLRRPHDAATWTVPLECDRLLLPMAPRRNEDLDRLVYRLARRGTICRVGAALAGPLDALPRATKDRRESRAVAGSRRLRLEIYGWALMYQPPWIRGHALVDADDRFRDLPALFELPQELIDRSEFLEARGFRTRPLVVPTLPGDFTRGTDGRPRNRFFPEAVCRPPRGIELLQ